MKDFALAAKILILSTTRWLVLSKKDQWWILLAFCSKIHVLLVTAWLSCDWSFGQLLMHAFEKELYKLFVMKSKPADRLIMKPPFGPFKIFSMILGWVTLSWFMNSGWNYAEHKSFVSFNVKPSKFGMNFIMYSSKGSNMKVKEKSVGVKRDKRLHKSLEIMWWSSKQVERFTKL